MSRTPIPFNASYVIDPETMCWLWTLPLNGSGYGGTFYQGKRMGAHRASYLMHVGPIPDGFQIDHLYRVRSCVNPEHLEPVTRAENGVRGIAGQNVAAVNQAKTTCPCGRAYDYLDARGWRSCRACRAEASRRFRRSAS